MKYELRVKTPEEGSLIEVLTVVVTVGAPVWAFFGTDIGKAFCKGLTGEEPAIWSEKAGVSIRKKISKPKKIDSTDAPEDRIEYLRSIPDALPEADISKEIEGELVALVLIGFLKSDAERLLKIGITPAKFRAAFQGRNRVFKGCIDNSEVKGITFDRSSDFPIKRRDFLKQITPLPDSSPDDPIKPSDLSFETVDISVNSPNWKRDGRKWQAATRQHKDISFSIEDEEFWLRVEQDDPDLKPTLHDNMRVQWAYPAGVAKPSHVRVLRVLSYNGRPLSMPMTDQEIQALQSPVHHVEPDMPDLFDERRGAYDQNDTGDE